MSKARSFEEFYSQPQGPHAFIQYKGTDICADLHCACGAHLHADGYFCYRFQCPHCKRQYKLDIYIPLIEMTPEEIATEKYHSVFGGSEDQHIDTDHEVTEACGTSACDECVANRKAQGQ